MLGGGRAFLNHRSFDVLVTLGAVATVHLLRKCIAAPWPPGSTERRMRWLVWLPVALMPLVVSSLFSVWEAATGRPGPAGPSIFAVLKAMAFVMHILVLGSPPIAAWCAIGIHLKDVEPFSWRGFARQSSVDLLAAFREWLPVLVIIAGYAWMEVVIGYPATTRDAWMQSADRWLFGGHDAVEALQAVISRPLSESMAFVYSAFALLYPVCLGAVFMTGREGFRETCFAVTAALAVGYCCYVLVPVKGPVFTRSFQVPLDFYYVGSVKEALMDRNRIMFDCFPSLHTAAALVLSWGCYRHARRVFWLTLPVVAFTPVACVYLRYHYVVDCLAGGLLAFGLMVATPKVLGRWRSQ